MPRPKGSFKTPSYRLHKPSGRAIVTLDGRDVPLGKWGTEESKQKYNRLIGEWLLRGKQGPSATDPSTATVAQLVAGYVQDRLATCELHRARNADVYTPGGHRSKLHSTEACAVRWLVSRYGDTLVSEFGPLKYKALRNEMIRAPLVRQGKGNRGKTVSRRFANAMMQAVKYVFRWGAEREMVPASVVHALSLVPALMPGCGARETGKVRPVDRKHVDAVLEVANGQLGDMIRLQLLTGMRPGELVQMRWVDIDAKEKVWRYAPPSHKTQHKGIDRVILIGPEAQKILDRYRTLDLHPRPIFRPAAGMDRAMFRQDDRGRWQVTRFPTSILPNMKRGAYTTLTYSAQVLRICRRADRLAHLRRPDVAADVRLVPDWHAHQLRHNAATELRRQFGVDVARAVLGHTSVDMTEVYAEIDVTAAERAIAQVG